MSSHLRRLAVAVTFIVATFGSRQAQAQQAAVIATATVVGQPLTLRMVTSSASGTELMVGIEGCGSGSLAVEGHRADGAVVHIARRDLRTDEGCGRRTLLLPLVHRDSAQLLRFEVRLSQGDALLAPSVAQVVIDAAATRTGARQALMY